MDVVVNAAVRLRPSFPDLTVAIAGRGRDAERLAARIAETGSPTHLLGALSDDELPRLIGAADIFVMACRNRWLGLEQEGFGIVFLEAAASGVPQVAGRSGGAGEAVLDGETGLVVHRPGDIGEVATALRRLLDDGELRDRLGKASGFGPRHPSTTTTSPLGWPRARGRGRLSFLCARMWALFPCAR